MSVAMHEQQHTVMRRDPRREWQQRNRLHPQHLVALFDGGAASDEKIFGPSGVWRRDPRARFFIGPNGLRRVDRGNSSAKASVAGQAGGAVTAKTERPLHRVDDPNQMILVVADMTGGRLSGHDRDLLGLGQALAEQLSAAASHDEAVRCAVTLVVFGEHREDDLALTGVDRLIYFEGADYQGFNPELRLEVLQALEKQWQPAYWLFPDSPYGGRDLGLRLAAAEGIAAATGIWQATMENMTYRGGSELVDVTSTPKRIMIALEECAMPVTRTRHEVLPLDVPNANDAIAFGIEDHGNLVMDPNQIALAEAEFVLSGGNGIRDWELFHRASAALGATEGASRVAVDDGFMERSRQVGATGTWVSARVYLAVGISGAIQHLQGITRCDKVIAINLDKDCDMVKRADLSVIGDAGAILQELMQLVENHRQSMAISSESGDSLFDQEVKQSVL